MQTDIFVELVLDNLFEFILDPLQLILIGSLIGNKEISDKFPLPYSFLSTLKLLEYFLHTSNIHHIFIFHVPLLTSIRLKDNTLQICKLFLTHLCIADLRFQKSIQNVVNYIECHLVVAYPFYWLILVVEQKLYVLFEMFGMWS